MEILLEFFSNESVIDLIILGGSSIFGVGVMAYIAPILKQVPGIIKKSKEKEKEEE